MAAWSWVGEDKIHSLITGQESFFDRRLRGERLRPFLDVLRSADVVTGHNVLRFDLLVLNAECARCGLPPLDGVIVEDTIRLKRTKGLKKGQENLAKTFGVEEGKLALDWAEWDDAYEDDAWSVPRDRCESDVAQHKALRERLMAEGWTKRYVIWRP